jgi:hypothetical protein
MTTQTGLHTRNSTSKSIGDITQLGTALGSELGPPLRRPLGSELVMELGRELGSELGKSQFGLDLWMELGKELHTSLCLVSNQEQYLGQHYTRLIPIDRRIITPCLAYSTMWHMSLHREGSCATTGFLEQIKIYTAWLMAGEKQVTQNGYTHTVQQDSKKVW